MPVQRCPQCGTPRRGDLQVCVRCETRFDAPVGAEARAGDGERDVDLALPRPAAPSTTQSHGTLAFALLGGFVVVAVVLYFSVRGIGPFRGSLVSQRVTGSTAHVTLSVENRGSRAGRGNCEIQLKNSRGESTPGHRVTTPKVAAHKSLVYDTDLVLPPGEQLAGTVRC